MSAFDRWSAALFAGLLGWFVGKALGVPIWRDWDIGDRTDMALTAALLVLCLTRPRKSPPPSSMPVAPEQGEK